MHANGSSIIGLTLLHHNRISLPTYLEHRNPTRDAKEVRGQNIEEAVVKFQ